MLFPSSDGRWTQHICSESTNVCTCSRHESKDRGVNQKTTASVCTVTSPWSLPRLCSLGLDLLCWVVGCRRHERMQSDGSPLYFLTQGLTGCLDCLASKPQFLPSTASTGVQEGSLTPGFLCGCRGRGDIRKKIYDFNS